MAYNVLKGNVQFINSDSGSIESIVDDHSNQTIAGIKTFSTAITSSGFFNSSGGGSSIVSSPITTLFGAGEDRIAIFSGSNDLTASTGFTYNQTVLAVTGNISASVNVSGSGFYGSGVGLTALPAASITGQINAANVNIGNGLTNIGGALTISGSDTSMNIGATGISIKGAGSTSGLKVGSGGLRADPNRGTAIGALASGDEFLVADVDDSNNLKKSTITQLQTYMQNSLTFGGAAGSDTQVQFNSSGDFAGDNAFTFNSSTNILTVSGVSSSVNISASAFYGNGANLTGLATNAYNSFTTNFNVFKEHDLIGIVTTGSAITASLPSAVTFDPGQRVTFKDVSGSCSGSNHIVISASAHHTGDRIDGQGIVKIKAGYGAVTLASDGVQNFFIVSTS
tara:strand:- start:1941 stop:3128 length:1188 start_codon:yes stop_codon:yes gene_type:complete